MQIEDDLIEAVIIDNYKNIILDVQLADGMFEHAFSPKADKTGEFYKSGDKVLLKKVDNELRKIKYEVVFVKKSGNPVFVDSRMDDRLFLEAYKRGVFVDFAEYTKVRKVPLGEIRSYFGFELTKAGPEKLYAYVASIYEKQDNHAVFPSCMGFEEFKVLDELAGLREEGYATVLLLIVPRGDCLDAKFVWNIDEVGAARIYDEAKNGLKIFCYGCKLEKNNINIDRQMKILY